MSDNARSANSSETFATLTTTQAGQALTANEELRLQQLLQLRYWYESHRVKNLNETAAGLNAAATAPTLPTTWELTQGFSLHEWQRECITRWFEQGRRGVVKVVTGAGKTALALAIVERLRNIEIPDLRVAVIVPTVVLLNQWLEVLREKSNLPADSIGRLGGGYSDSFSDNIRVLVCVINSAAKKLPGEVSRAQIGTKLLLVVDECHRAGATEMRHVLETPRAFSLGLSATPERDDEPEDLDDESPAPSTFDIPPFDQTILGRELGPVIYELSYAQAIERAILPPFRVVHYGLSLQDTERSKYERLSREIQDLRRDLETPNRRGLALIRWCRSKGAADNSKAQRLLSLTSDRKRLLYRITERSAAVEIILRQHFLESSDTKAILFHESIDEVMGIFSNLSHMGFPVVAEHSELPDIMRSESLRLFQHGTARIIVSARSLIEGFNVPSADIGIIVAASSSVRQRVQTLGRLLRKNTRLNGRDKQATLYVLYAASTVDELLYEKANWDQLIGAERNDYFLWTNVRTTNPGRQSAPPRSPLPKESSIDVSALSPGASYPGDPDEGALFTQDTQGTIRDDSGRLIKPQPELALLLRSPHSGRFRVTLVHHFVTKLEKTPNGWRTIFLGQLKEFPEIADNNSAELNSISPGDSFPLGRVVGRVFSVLQRDRRLIAEKTNGHVRFILSPEDLGDQTKADALRSILRQITATHARGHRINKITVTPEGYVVYVFNNEAYFLGLAPEGSVGFLFGE